MQTAANVILSRVEESNEDRPPMKMVFQMDFNLFFNKFQRKT